MRGAQLCAMSDEDKANFSWAPQAAEDLEEWNRKIARGEQPREVYCRSCGDGSDIMFACDGEGCCRSFCGGPNSCLAWYLPRGEAPECEDWFCPNCESGDRISASGSRFVRNVQWLQNYQKDSKRGHLHEYWPDYVQNDAVICGFVWKSVKGSKQERVWCDGVRVLCIFQDMVYVEYADLPNSSFSVTDTLRRTQVSFILSCQVHTAANSTLAGEASWERAQDSSRLVQGEESRNQDSRQGQRHPSIRTHVARGCV